MLMLRASLVLLIVVSLGVKSEPEGDNSTTKSTKQSTLTEQNTVPSTETSRPTPKPTAARSGLARLMNDIFQIPISVLKAVSDFLSNNFGGGQKGK